jgi:nucleotide-binding universal stress UspA family protein
MESRVKDPGRAAGLFKRVIVGVDEHQGGRDALALAQSLVARGGSLVLARVSIRDSLMGRRSSPDIELDPVPAELGPAATAGDEIEGDGPLRTIEASSVGRGLHELAAADGADLLVVGSCRRGLIGRAMIGDDTGDGLNGAPCAVAIAPFGHAERSPALAEIGVAYNGSRESDDALAVARALVAEHEARLSAFEAVSIPYYMTVPGAGTVIATLPALVEQARELITALGGVESHATYGVAAEELAVYSASLDLLVVGSRGYGPLGRLVHGTTSRQLARTARCPLLVLTRGARAVMPVDLDAAGSAPAVSRPLAISARV